MMASVPSKSELAVRVQALESRSARYDEDIACLVDTTSETLERVKRLEDDVTILRGDVTGLKEGVTGLEGGVTGLKGDVEWMKAGMAALLAHQGITLEAGPAAPPAGDDLAERE